MKTVFHDAKITGLLSVLPKNSVSFEDELENYTFPPKQTMRLQKVMGFRRHSFVKEDTAASDLAAAGLEQLFETGRLCREEIGALVVACSYPDHFIPPVSSILHGKFELPEDMFCTDLSQGCGGFLMALTECLMLLDHLEPGKKAVAVATDVLSKRVSRRDRNSWPLIGDAAGIAIVERCPDAGEIHTVIYNNGGLGSALIVPAGGSRMPGTSETACLEDRDRDGNLRALDNLVMQGADVFNFMLSKVPPLIEETLSFAGVSKEQVNWYLFHQPNRFMLQKLAEKLDVPYEKMPMNVVEEFGNSSGACIPVCATHNLSGELTAGKEKTCCLSAFGSGLMWGAMVMKMGGMDFCEMLVSNC